jgi:hypothetical protein
VCQFDEHYVIRTDEDALRLAELGCERIEGDLSLDGYSHDEGLPLADLSSIREVTGSVRLGNAFGFESLPGLERIGCVLYVGRGADLRVELAALSYVGVGLSLNQTSQLQVASFPSLLEVGFGSTDACGDGYVPMGLLFYINPQLIQVDMPVLERVGERIFILENPALEAVCFPSLTEVVPREGNDTESTLDALDEPFVCLPSELSDALGRDAACSPALCQ